MKRKPMHYAALLSDTQERLGFARKRLAADPSNPTHIKEVERLEGDVKKLERYAAQEAANA